MLIVLEKYMGFPIFYYHDIKCYQGQKNRNNSVYLHIISYISVWIYLKIQSKTLPNKNKNIISWHECFKFPSELNLATFPRLGWFYFLSVLFKLQIDFFHTIYSDYYFPSLYSSQLLFTSLHTRVYFLSVLP